MNEQNYAKLCRSFRTMKTVVWFATGQKHVKALMWHEQVYTEVHHHMYARWYQWHGLHYTSPVHLPISR